MFFGFVFFLIYLVSLTNILELTLDLKMQMSIDLFICGEIRYLSDRDDANNFTIINLRGRFYSNELYVHISYSDL